MAVTLEQYGLDRLPPDERMELLGLLWDSLEPGGWTPPNWHLHVLAERRAAAEADPAAGIPWSEFKARWRGQT